ncbi:MAG: hypothetical protein SWY16_15330 [Cyanobacteriota bacterium]|nr:hypothetical protein [Cyanobacteriota bacterium]
MLTSIFILIPVTYIILVLLANFGEGQCDIEYCLEYSSVPIAGDRETSVLEESECKQYFSY